MKHLCAAIVYVLCLYLPGHLMAQEEPGIIMTFAGTGNPNFSGDGGPAAQARLNFPRGVAVDAKGVVYIADTDNHRVRRVGLDGVITTFAGIRGFSGDGGAAAQASLHSPFGVAVDTKGAVYIADTGNQRVQRVGLDGATTTFARSKLMFPGSKPVGRQGRGLSGNRESSLPPPFFLVVGVAVDVAGAVYIADGDNHRIRRVEPDGIITTFAGKGDRSFSGGVPVKGGTQISVAIDIRCSYLEENAPQGGLHLWTVPPAFVGIQNVSGTDTLENKRGSGSMIGIAVHHVFTVKPAVVWFTFAPVRPIGTFVLMKRRIGVEPLLWPRVCPFEPQVAC